MQLNENLAEVVGAFIGDGCISEYDVQNRGRRCVVLFTGHCKNDESYYLLRLVATVRREFNYERKLYYRKDDNTIRYVITARRVINFFKELGLPTGEKGDRIEIPKVVANDEKLALACVRGIFNADGSLYRRYSKRYAGHSRAYCDYVVIQFKMKNHTVIRQLKGILEKHEIKVNRITRVLNCSVIRITEQASVGKFVDLVGFTHPYHEKRYYDIINKKHQSVSVYYNFKDMQSKVDNNPGL